ncbi:MAG: tRNA epoxyqueuosine(34) reductase QueG [Calditrichaeota bacterium]|nr:MAG: tRNA epoxyqueuosine(34) reductase QueG [Calditrichota bacterium]
MSSEKISPANFESLLKNQAHELGFDLFGIARIEKIPEMDFYSNWIKKGFHAAMGYLARHEEKKCDPSLIVDGAKSVLVCGKNYNTNHPYSTDSSSKNQAWISRYAWGNDYHDSIKSAIIELNNYWLKISENQYAGRYYVDTGPVFERAWASQAGIGWSGKNCCTINREQGSWLFLAVIITDAELQAGQKSADFCGSCTACIDACPTNALRAPYILDSNLCISYHTIENRGAIPQQLQPEFGRQIFGCDICQDVCPWNRKARYSSEPDFQPREQLINPDLRFLLQLDEEKFRSLFRKSPVKRTKYGGFMRNVLIAAGNSGDIGLIEFIKPFLENENDLLKNQAESSLKLLSDKNKIEE